MSPRILIIDDEVNIRKMLSILLKKKGYFIDVAPNGAVGIELIRQQEYDLVLTDLKMPKKSGLDVLDAVQATSNGTQVILMTAFASANTAIEAMKRGARDYVTKPFNMKKLLVQIEKAIDVRSLERENLLLRQQLSKQHSSGIVGTSPAMQAVFEMVGRVAQSRTTILLSGQSGTGKEVIAKKIHEHSGRNGAFVPVNCGAIPETLIESELFGHIKGSFTGAFSNRDGLFVAAKNGTIFLDEIGELPLSMQVKLLRVLQERKIKRIGDSREQNISCRIIAATNKNLREMIKKNSFREDLFYRLNVIEIELPSLSERREDIPALLQHFIAKYAKEADRKIRGIEREAMDRLLDHRYDGNVRELENIIERAVTLTTGDTIELASLPALLRDKKIVANFDATVLPEDGLNLETLVEKLERNLIAQALERTSGNQTEAAKLLGIGFRQIRYRLKKYNIDASITFDN